MPDPVDSLWAAQARVAPAPATRLREPITADVAIVGGGFTGLSCALHLAEGGMKVVVLEAETIGFGASGRNGGQVNPGLKFGEAALAAKFGEPGRGFYRMGQEAPQFLEDLIRRKSLACGFSRPGLLRLAHNRNALSTLRDAARNLRSDGVPVEELDASGVERRVGTSRYPGGLFDPRGGRVQPLELAREMARASREAGAVIYEHSRATQLRREGAGWLVDAGGGNVRAKHVVVVTNGYTDGLIPELAQSLLPVNSFQIATAPLPRTLTDRIIPGGQAVYDSRRLVLYFRKSDDGRLILGGRASFKSTERGGVVADYSTLESVLHGIYPELRGIPIEKRWTGLVCITFDYLPHYHKPDENLHVLLGFNGRGVAMSHRSGAWLARRLMQIPDDCEIPATDIRPIPLHRFRPLILDMGMRWNRLLDLVGR